MPNASLNTVTLQYHNVITLWYIKFKGLHWIYCVYNNLCIDSVVIGINKEKYIRL